jgi:hypothetical protein
MDIIKNIKGCDKLKSRNLFVKILSKNLSQNCSKKCSNALKKGLLYRSYKEMPNPKSFNIRDRQPDICGRSFKPLTKKEKEFKKKRGNKFWIKTDKELKEYEQYKKKEKEFNKTALLTKVEQCDNLKSKRRFRIKTVNCKEECKGEFKKKLFKKKFRSKNTF